MPTVTRSFPATQPIEPPTSAPPRVLAGATGARPAAPRPAAAQPAVPVPVRAQVQPAATAQAAVPRWAKGVVIGGVLLAVAMPASVLLSRSALVQEALVEQSSSKASMVCTAGEGRAVDGSSVVGWLFGGSYFSCGDWQTREARQQRAREQSEASYMARQKARQNY